MGGHHELTRLGMGLKNSSACLMRALELLMRGLTYKVVFCYIDDFLILSKTYDEHMTHLREVFSRLRAGNLVLKASKCHLAKKSIHYLGFIIEPGIMKIDPERLHAVTDFSQPTNLKELRRYLGMTSWFRSFIRGYSDICQPLYALTKHNAPFNWSTECSSAFTRLKKCLTSADVLTLPNPNLPFRLYCDCSGYSIGFMVTQTSNNVERVCLYGGRGLSDLEKRHAITDQEMTAVRYGLQKNLSLFRYSKVEIITDHSAIKFILDQPSPNGRHSRFIAFLSSFDYTISHRPGNSIHLKVPDALSRRVYEPQSADDEADEFLQGFDIIESETHELKDKQPPDAEGAKLNRVPGRPPRGLATVAALSTDADHEIDREILIKEQRNDSDLKPILDYLLNGILPSEPQAMRKILLSQADYYIDNDILYHVELFNGRGKRTGS